MPGPGGSQGVPQFLGVVRPRAWRFLAPGALVLALSVLGSLVLVPTTVASAGVSSDKAEISQLEQRILQDGAVVEQFVNSYNQAQATEDALEIRLELTKAHLASDERTQSQAMSVLRKIAIGSYVSDSDGASTLSVFETSNATKLAEQQEYSQIANSRLRDAVDAVEIDEAQTQASESQLRSAEAKEQDTLTQLAAARVSAQAALNADQSLLDQAQSNLQSLLAAIAQRAAAEEQQEEEMAQEAPAQPVSVSVTPSPGAYANPLRSIQDLYPERIDQGVDYSGYGPIYAVGDGVVLSTTNAGWPGGTFIAYRLTDGPAAGLVVYAAEDIDPAVSIGQTVNAATVLGTMYEGPDGIETGWSDPSGDGDSMARDYGQFFGANSTAFGANFSQLLALLGAPPGVLQNDPPTGSLPPGWPTW